MSPKERPYRIPTPDVRDLVRPALMKMPPECRKHYAREIRICVRIHHTTEWMLKRIVATKPFDYARFSAIAECRSKAAERHHEICFGRILGMSTRTKLQAEPIRAGMAAMEALA